MTTTPELLPVPVAGERWRVDPLRLAVAGPRPLPRRDAPPRRVRPARVPDLAPGAWPRPVGRETPAHAASTVSRRMSVVSGFYRICVINEILERSPADDLRRPDVPPEPPTLGLTHSQLEGLLVAARTSDNPCHFALVAPSVDAEVLASGTAGGTILLCRR